MPNFWQIWGKNRLGDRNQELGDRSWRIVDYILKYYFMN